VSGQGSTGDFFYVPTTEKMLKLRRHEHIEAATMELTAILKEAFTSCFQDLQKRRQQCIVCSGDYFEGDRNHYKLNFVFFTDSVSELYGQRVYSVKKYIMVIIVPSLFRCL
jgi:hypothetical protein